MLLAQSLSWPEWGLLGTVLVCTAIVLRRAFSGGGAQANQPDEESEQTETMAARRIASLEVHIYDFAREVEARLEKRAVELDALVAAADREIVRLTDLLKVASLPQHPRGPDITQDFGDTGSAPQVSAAQEQMICRLHEAGYNVAEIAHMVGRPADAVNSVLRAA